MRCPSCSQAIKPGLEVVIQPGRIDAAHCPYCLAPLPAADHAAEQGEGDVSVERHAMRREVRREYVDQLRAASRDGQVRCPLCDHPLDSHSLVILENSQHFQCPRCSRDVAYQAYRREAYREQPWLRMAAVLADLKYNQRCVNCRFLGAAAIACQRALSWLPGGHAKEERLVSTMVRHPDQALPDADCQQGCLALEHYRRDVGRRMLLL